MAQPSTTVRLWQCVLPIFPVALMHTFRAFRQVIIESWSPIYLCMYHSYSPNHVIETAFLQCSAVSRKTVTYGNEPAGLCKSLTFHSLSIAPHDPNHNAGHPQTGLHALYPPVSFLTRPFRTPPLRALDSCLRHYAATQRQGFQAALPKATVRAVELCGCACYD